MAMLLGVDVGTTAVKGALVDASTRRLVASSSAPTDAYADAGVGRFEQRVDAILAAVKSVLAELPPRELALMHGIVWWRAAEVVQAAETVLSGGTVDRPAWSRLVTWEDQRCSQGFLEKLESRVDEARQSAGGAGGLSSRLASGYGLATYAHTLETNRESLEVFDACGTIHDLLAFILCGHIAPEAATIDTTNACSWGGFDIARQQWNWVSVDALGIPRGVLPTASKPGSIIGRTPTRSVIGIPAGVGVFVPMGDHPCSVVAAVTGQQEADATLSLINIGTSAQLAMILPIDALGNSSDSRSFEIRPYVDDNHVLGVAAALSGGNMFAWFVRRCKEWMADLAGTEIDESAIYEKLIQLGLQKTDTNLQFHPTLNGERATPDKFGAIDSLQLHNGSLGDVSASLCRGLVQNLVGMVPQDLRSHFQSSRTIGTGNALVRNSLLQLFLVRELGSRDQLVLQDAADAAVGAALVPSFIGCK